jgi:hypothetical protein
MGLFVGEQGSNNIEAIQAIEEKKKELIALLEKAQQAELKAKKKEEQLLVLQVIIDYNHHVQACDTVIKLLKNEDPR